MAQLRNGTRLHWDRRRIELTIVEPHRRSEITQQMLREALQSGIDAWNGATTGCRAPRLTLTGRLETRPWLAQDGRSLVMVRSRVDCDRDQDSSALCTDSDTTARTHLYPAQTSRTAKDGLLEEADIEINAVHHKWSLDSDATSPSSLRRVMHHELGHVLGLDHPCSDNPSGASSNPAMPNCQAPAMLERLMQPGASISGHGISLVPDDEDVSALCLQYGKKPFFSCSVGAAHSGGLSQRNLPDAISLLALLLAAIRRSVPRSQ